MDSPSDSLSGSLSNSLSNSHPIIHSNRSNLKVLVSKWPHECVEHDKIKICLEITWFLIYNAHFLLFLIYEIFKKVFEIFIDCIA